METTKKLNKILKSCTNKTKICINSVFKKCTAVSRKDLIDITPRNKIKNLCTQHTV